MAGRMTATDPSADPEPDLRVVLDEAHRLASTSPTEARALLRDLRAAGTEGARWAAELALVEARVAFTEGRYEAARGHVADSAAVAGRLGDERLLATGQNLAGTIHLEQGDYEAASLAFAAARERFLATGDRAGVARVQNNLGLVHWRLDDLDDAREAFEEALAVFRDLGDDRLVGNVLNSLGLVASSRGDSLESLARYGEARTILAGAGEPVFLANVLANIADELETLGRRDEAVGPALEALALREAVGHTRGIAGSCVALARLAVARGDLDAAASHAARAGELVERLGLRKHRADLVEVEARIDAARGEFRAAFERSQEVARLRQELAQDDLRKRVAEIQARYTVEKARREAEARGRENEALRAAKEAADAASRAKSEFVATMSHEIRTPVAALLGAIDLLADGPLERSQAELVAAIRSSGATLLAVVSDVLDFAAIEAGRVELRPCAFSPAALVADVASFARVRAARKGLEFVVEASAVGEPVRWGDDGRVRQVLVNLLSNAVKFTDRGRVTLRAVPGEGDELDFEVSDTGPGIDAATLARLFQPFVQGDSSTRRRHGGTGLGLVIARRLAERLGGRLDVTSAPGEGSTFRVSIPLPLARSDPAAGEAPRDVPLDLDVLLVEDDPTLVGILAELLRRAGCRVEMAADGFAALAAIANGPPDAILLDMHLPGMDGCEVAEAVTARGGPRPYIVGLSGAATDEDRRRALEAGMDEYLTKPVHAARLVEALRAARKGA